MMTRLVRSPGRLANKKAADLGTITEAERLILWRHRQIDTEASEKKRVLWGDTPPISQKEAARRLGVGKYVYNRMENNSRASMSLDTFKTLALTIVDILHPTIPELCFLARRRSGMSLRDICENMGVSRPTFYLREESGDESLVRYWESLGFSFPKEGADAVDDGDPDGSEVIDSKRFHEGQRR